MTNLTKRSRIDNGYIPQTLRDEAKRNRCEACGRAYGEWVYTTRGRVIRLKQVIDHIFPRRWLLNFRETPNISVNLVSICNSCHPQKIKAENALFEGNALTYVRELRRLLWPSRIIRRAAEFYRLQEVCSLLDREGKMG